MKSFEAKCTIERSAADVWAVLVDTAAWPEWDPYCEKIEGTLALGQKIKAFSTLSPGRAFPVKVSELSAPSRMTWSGGMPLGLFKGVRTFVLSADGDRTEFTVREEFSGPMLALIGRTIPDMTEPFQKFVEGLKSRAEGKAA